MKLTRKTLRGLIRESLRDMILEAGDAAISVKGIADGVDAAAANLKSSYETLVSNLSSVRVPGIYSGIPLKAFYGIRTGVGMGSAGGSGTLYGFPLLSSDPDSIFSNYATLGADLKPDDWYNAPSLKILEQLPEKEDKDAVLKVLKRYYPILAQAGTIYATAKGNALFTLAELWEYTFDPEEKAEAATAINKIIKTDPRIELARNHIVPIAGMLGWQPSALRWDPSIIDNDILSRTAPVLRDNFGIKIDIDSSFAISVG